MAFTGTVTFTFPQLTDQDVWFANADAFNDFMSSGTGSFSISAIIENDVYTPVPFNNLLNYENFNIDGIDHVVPSKAQFDSLQAQVAALEAYFQAFLTAGKDAGFFEHDTT